MKKQEMSIWRRRELFEFFSKMSQPFYSVTFTVEVTKLYDYVKKNGLSFYYALVYLCTKAINETDAFLYIIRNGEIYKTDGLIYFSCLPWVELTALTNERDFDPDDSVPRIAWGKYHDENGIKKLQISMELNHRLADGYHVGKFYEALSREIEAL